MARYVVDISTSGINYSCNKIVELIGNVGNTTVHCIDPTNTNQFHDSPLDNRLSARQIANYHSQLAESALNNGFWDIYEYLTDKGWELDSEPNTRDVVKIKFLLQERGYDLNFTKTTANILDEGGIILAANSDIELVAVYQVLFKLVFIKGFKL